MLRKLRDAVLVNVGRVIRLGGIVVVGVVTLTAALFVAAPKVSEITKAHSFDLPPVTLEPLSERSYVYDRFGNQMATFVSEENREQVRIEDVPRTVIDSVLAAEDSSFYSHQGVNARSIARALTANIESGDVAQGGSTITQQVVKNAIVGGEQDFARKIREAVLAVELEEQYTKDEILERYLNTIYLGSGAYGVQAAAQVYFGKEVSELGWAEGAMLAGIIRCPVSCDPFRGQSQTIARRATVLDSLYATGRITELERDASKFTPLPTEPNLPQQPDDYFLEAVKQQLLDDPRLGDTPTARYRTLYGGGLRVYTTFDQAMYFQAQVARNETLPKHNGDGTFTLASAPNGARRIGTAAMAGVEPRTGAVRFLVGGPGFERYQFDLSLSAKRSVGSTFKTFVLAEAILQGLSPDDLIDGSGPCKIPGYPEDDLPGNFGGGRGGTGSLTSQTLRSSNCAFLRLNQIVGPERVAELARRMGVTSPLQPQNASMALGTDGISPLDMAAAYSVLANDGVRNPAYLIERVEDVDGDVLFAHEPAPERVLPEQVARTVTDVLRQNVESGTGTNARIGAQPAAGKTGTTNGPSDVWFVGYTPQLSTSVWIGSTSDNLPLQEVGTSVTGGAIPARTWGAFMREALRGVPVEEFIKPAPRTDRVERLCLEFEERRCPRGSIVGPDGETAGDDDDDDFDFDGGR
ncbi:MAG TPA: transglycosylase domain-containing protein [Iamia sp.]|nr:transglycosylase domain-containing protein [Iamia sp.]